MSGYEAESISSTDDGFTIGYESIVETGKKLTYGVGGEFMLRKSIENIIGDFGFNSLYGFGRYQIDDKLYGIGRLGYNFFVGDNDFKDCGLCSVELEGGSFYGIGVGVILNPKISFEGLYIHNKGNFVANFGSYILIQEINYSRVLLGFTYKY